MLLRPFGAKGAKLKSKGLATFAIDLVPTLPEDVWDHQPLVFDDSILVADIRLDNREELWEALSITASDLKETSDSALLAAAWLKWGVDLLRRCIGDFSVAVYSTDRRRLWLARSVGGARPLFYSATAGQTAFASMPSGLMANPEQRRGFNFSHLALALDEREEANSDATCFEGIRRVRPGEVVTIGQNGVERQPIWTPSLEPLHLRSTSEYVEAYRGVLDESVRCRLRRSVSMIGSHLSAGYDSNAVTATAARLLEDKAQLIALTAAPRRGYAGPTFAGRPADELALAAVTARHHHIRHHVGRSHADPRDLFREQAGLYQDPIRNVLNSAWDFCLRQAAQQSGANVILTGDLGNLTLNAGGIDVLSDLVRSSRWLTWVREAFAARRNYSALSIIGNSIDPQIADTMRRGRAMLSPARHRQRTSFLRAEWETASQKTAASNDGANSRRWESIESFDPGRVWKGALAETGTETRCPMIDRRVIEFSLRLPPEQLFLEGAPSPLAKAALCDRVPQEILSKRLRGYQAADWHEWFTRDVARTMMEEISVSKSAQELLDLDRLSTAIARWPAVALESAQVVNCYTSAIPRALATGYLLRHFETLCQN